jgi:hypothetical protein
MSPADTALVAAIRDAIDQEPLPSIHRLDCHCSPRDDAACLELRELLAALVASWVGPLEEAIAWACGEGDSDFADRIPFGGKPRFWWRSELRRRASLAALPWRKEER